MTYIALGGMLNPTHSLYLELINAVLFNLFFSFIQFVHVCLV